MISKMRKTALIGTALMMMPAMAAAQTPRQKPGLSVQGFPGEARVIQFNGRAFVDVEELARTTNSSITFEKGRTVLALPRCDASEPAGGNSSAFSPAFRRAAIQAMASMREWGGMLMITVQNGYPVGNTMAGTTIAEFQGRTADNIGLAAAAASSDADNHGLELLRNEFNNVQAWADSFIKARSSMSAANYAVSDNPLKNDPEAQKILSCGQLLAQMFAAGTFQDTAACR